MERTPWRQYLRRRQAAPLRVELQLPAGDYTLTLYDLDRQEKTVRPCSAPGVVDLGRTDHDFALLVVKGK